MASIEAKLVGGILIYACLLSGNVDYHVAPGNARKGYRMLSPNVTHVEEEDIPVIHFCAALWILVYNIDGTTCASLLSVSP